MQLNIKILKSLICTISVVIQGFIFSVNAQSAKEEKDINLVDLPVQTIIDSLSVQFGANFSYNADLEILRQIKTIQKKATLECALQSLFKESEVEFSISDKQVVLFKVLNTTKGKPLKVENPEFLLVSGKVCANKASEPLAYASVCLFGTTISTVSNNSGEFKIKVPYKFINDSLIIGYIGFVSQKIPLSSGVDSTLNVILEEYTTYIDPVLIKPLSAESIVKEVIHVAHDNYSRKNVMYGAFYRESTKCQDAYLSVSEALLDIAKAPYSSGFLNDQARIFRGRKKEDLTKLKHLSYKLEGGVYNSLRLDVMKDAASFLSEDGMKFYNYKLRGALQYNGRNLYIIDFASDKSIDDISYNGVLYVDIERKALVAARFEMSSEGLKFARSLLIKKQPRKINIKPVAAKYVVLYRFINGKYYLDYTRAELTIKAKSERLFVNDKFQAVSELVVTEIDTLNTGRFKRSEIVKPNDILLDNITSYDEAFWGSFNTIVPEKHFTEAVEKIQYLQQKAE